MTDEELKELARVFPELDWMSEKDWKTVALFADWETWISDWLWQEEFDNDSERALYRMLKLRENRIQVRKDCRRYFGEENVPNINDPSQSTWA